MILGLICAGSSYIADPPLHDGSPCSWLDGVIPHFQLTVPAAGETLCVLLLWTFSVAMTTPVPHAARRLPAVDPNVAEALAIVTLSQTIV
jgi:hypothetical protein